MAMRLRATFTRFTRFKGFKGFESRGGIIRRFAFGNWKLEQPSLTSSDLECAKLNGDTSGSLGPAACLQVRLPSSQWSVNGELETASANLIIACIRSPDRLCVPIHISIHTS